MIRVNIDEKLERRLRELAMRRFGYSEDAISRAVEEAILMWISSAEEFMTFEGDPVEAIDGIISDVNISSVNLQRRIRDTWISKVLSDAPVDIASS